MNFTVGNVHNCDNVSSMDIMNMIHFMKDRNICDFQQRCFGCCDSATQPCNCIHTIKVIHTWENPRGKIKYPPEFQNHSNKYQSILHSWIYHKRSYIGINTSGPVYDGYVESLLTSLVLQKYHFYELGSSELVSGGTYVFDIKNWLSDYGINEILEKLSLKFNTITDVKNLFKSASISGTKYYINTLWHKPFLELIFGKDLLKQQCDVFRNLANKNTHTLDEKITRLIGKKYKHEEDIFALSPISKRVMKKNFLHTMV